MPDCPRSPASSKRQSMQAKLAAAREKIQAMQSHGPSSPPRVGPAANPASALPSLDSRLLLWLTVSEYSRAPDPAIDSAVAIEVIALPGAHTLAALCARFVIQARVR